MDLEELAAIIEQLDKTEFTDFLFEQGDLRIRVTRAGHLTDSVGPTPDTSSATCSAAADSAAAEGAAPLSPAPAPPATSGTSGDVLADGLLTVKAPMLGTFYRSPKPGEPPFVQVGDAITVDTTVGIVEVMKLMNSIPAGIDGEVVQILADDGDLVEFDQPLLAVRAS